MVVVSSVGRLVDVAVNSGQPARRPFTYRERPKMRVTTGQAVFVPYGPRLLQGVVVGFPDQSEVSEVREIDAIADSHPVLDSVHIDLAYWLSNEYLAPLWDCLSVCLPHGYGQKSVTMVSAVDVPPLLPVNPGDHKVLAALGGREQLTLEALREKVGSVTLERLRKLQAAGQITVTQGLARPAGNPRFERRLRPLRPSAELRTEGRRLATAQARSVAARLLVGLADSGELTLGEAREMGVQRKHVEHLIEQGWLEEVEIRLDRAPYELLPATSTQPLRLSDAQQAVADAIWDTPGEHLLHGVTGAGKTEVYLDLIRRVLDDGASAIVLVPEISLTPQAMRRLGERFGDQLAIFHSGLSGGELYDQWYQVQSGEKRLVLGSRSALFVPAPRVQLIVLDEEHEPSYKQSDPQPRYHARSAARFLAGLTGARLVLGSATPDVTSYARAKGGQASLHVLDERLIPDGNGRVRPGKPPTIEVVDMREELKAGNRGIFSIPLVRAVRQALTEGNQSILFVNRRGAARFMLCRDCGYVPECPTCRVAMGLDTTDAIAPRLICHHCGRSRKLDEECPRCRKKRYRPFGVGTQRIEYEAHRAFPGARIARWDSDTSRRKGAHESLVARLEAGEIDVVVGTQLLAKGLDLPRMTVAGAVDADVGLHLPTYLAPERTYQLLAQVSGRVGRRDQPGRAFIQTYEPGHAAIVAAATGGYEQFYELEMEHRRRAAYPPFGRLARLTFRHPKQEHGLEESSRVATELRAHRDAAGRTDPDVLGPSPAYIRRIRGDYRWNVLLRGRNPGQLLDKVRFGPRWTVDIDPVNLL